MRSLLTIAILKNFTVYATDVASAFLNTPIERGAGTTTKRVLPQRTTHTLSLMDYAHHQNNGKKTWPKLGTTLQQLGFTRFKSDACVFVITRSTIYIMDNPLGVGDSATTQPFLQQFQQHLELKHTSQLTRTTPLEFL
eukprot:1649624-Amphidinium_carterae.4